MFFFKKDKKDNIYIKEKNYNNYYQKIKIKTRNP